MVINVDLVHAFTLNGEGGNPAGVVLDAGELSDAQMQSVATEIGASETAFILPGKETTHHIRFFTPTTEVDLCGHATIASWSLMQQKKLHPAGHYSQATKAGVIEIEVDETGQIFMQQPLQPIDKRIDEELICEALNITPEVLDKNFEPRIVRGNLMVSLKDKSTLNSLQPNFDAMVRICNQNAFYAFHVFVYSGTPDIVATVRDFCPAVGIPEDPATGTANGSLVAYLQHVGKLPLQDIYTIEQGAAMSRPSRILCKIQDDRVWVGGMATVAGQQNIDLVA
jgi:PhzF family phenazine biosynthesis protein